MADVAILDEDALNIDFMALCEVELNVSLSCEEAYGKKGDAHLVRHKVSSLWLLPMLCLSSSSSSLAAPGRVGFQKTCSPRWYV